MARRAGVLLGFTGLIAAVTTAVPPARLAATPHDFAVGRVWLLVTSGFVADRPVAASIVGVAVVGLATLALCGARVTLVAGVVGHVASAAVVYLALGLVRVFAPTAFDGAVSLPDYGTSAVIAAWIGALAYVVWTRRTRVGAVAFCTAAALLGWYCKGSLTVLDTEHAVALAIGTVAAAERATMPRRSPFRLHRSPSPTSPPSSSGA